MAASGPSTSQRGGGGRVGRPCKSITSKASDTNTAANPWELSDYEIQRRPQQTITDDTVIGSTSDQLRAELMCPICLDLLQETMTAKECLHRFCSECIIRALRAGNKECPTCRKKLASKRSLRPDPKIDLLIAKMFPSSEME